MHNASGQATPSSGPSTSKRASGPPARAVIKLGTGVLTRGIGEFDAERIAAICEQVARLRASGTQVLLVSSGSIALGMGRLGLKRRPSDVVKKQACAAIGQGLLMQMWQSHFAAHGITVAQVLLTHEDLRNRTRHLAAKATLESLIAYGVVPVINENDTVSAAEIEALLRFGDNDTLSAMVASLVHAQHLFILSTAPGLIDLDGTGEIVPFVPKITPQIEAMARGTASETAVGGMVSKLSAAKLALRAGCSVFIASGAEPDIIARLLRGEGPGTFFAPHGLPLDAKKRWLLHFQRPTGTIHINACAVPVLREQGRSLLAVGVTHASGRFEAGDIVDVAAPDGTLIAHGKTGYSSADISALAGLKGAAVKALHPKRRRHEVIHRNDLALL
ncbi:glutamate 5-kinase [Cephaloticoccus primus]|uniref:Glutamate 5-kinase n=1 Tax=Cephaloticoccus primus TaxID=1548207 RepID=A0A139SL06_9BACT|nr:glutamate 5-kinase [Cephaloticoccus primus]